MGGSTIVPARLRIPVWLETVPVLLKHLGTDHVHLVTHSAGTPYTLNTLAKYRDILYPHAPYVAILGPWVHTEHSAQTLWKAAALLPTAVISQLSGITEFMQQTVMPATTWSSGIFSSLSNPFRSDSKSEANETEMYQEMYGVDLQTGKALEKLKNAYKFAEGQIGGAQDAVLCLKKAGDGAWGACENYMKCISGLGASERERHDSPKLRVRLHFAGSDVMIGKEGQEYFETCWRQIGENIDLESKEWPDADHDGVLADLAKGAIKTVFEEIGRLTD